MANYRSRDRVRTVVIKKGGGKRISWRHRKVFGVKLQWWALGLVGVIVFLWGIIKFLADSSDKKPMDFIKDVQKAKKDVKEVKK